MIWRRLVWGGILFITSIPSLHGATDLAEKVIVVANKNVPESLEVAEYYMRRRGIPNKNLILIQTSKDEQITRNEYNDTIANPLITELIKKKWVNAIADNKDSTGRLKPIVFKKNFEYLVLCYGVPVHVKPVKELNDRLAREKYFKGEFEDQFSQGALSKNEASVDGELSVLLLPDSPLSGFIPNPYYRRVGQSKSDIIKVTRLDGPSSRAVIRMIAQGLEGERKGLKGKAYVDEDGRKGSYAQGNEWMADTADLWKNMGFSIVHNTDKATLSLMDQIDCPVLYAGWYTTDINEPFNLPGFEFPPGAIAVHLHSASASPLRTENKRWTGPFIARGVSATVGNTSEPYLSLTHNFSILFRALAEGKNFGDAVTMALPGLSWQGIAIGDPLFTPFTVSLDEQYKDIGDPRNALLDQYVVIRKMNLADSDKRISIGQRGFFMSPGPALGLRLARLYKNADNIPAAVKALKPFASVQIDSAQDWILFMEIGDLLATFGEPQLAFNTYRHILEAKLLSPKLRILLLEKLIPLGTEIKAYDIIQPWIQEIEASKSVSDIKP